MSSSRISRAKLFYCFCLYCIAEDSLPLAEKGAILSLVALWKRGSYATDDIVLTLRYSDLLEQAQVDATCFDHVLANLQTRGYISGLERKGNLLTCCLDCVGLWLETWIVREKRSQFHVV